MEWLFTFLLDRHRIAAHTSVALLALLFARLATGFLAKPHWSPWKRGLAFAVVADCACVGTLLDTLWFNYSGLLERLPLSALLVAGGLNLLTAGGAAAIWLRLKRSIKTVILAGGFLSFGMSFTVFYILIVAARPLALAYDLTAVVLVLGLGMIMCAVSFWELGGRFARSPQMSATGFLAFALTLLPLGSIGAILPFEQRIAAVGTAGAQFTPLSVITLSGCVVLLFMLAIAQLLDMRVTYSHERENDRMRHLADSTFEGILICQDGRIVEANRRILEMTGFDAAAIKTLGLSDLFVPVAHGASERPAALFPGEGRGHVPEQRELIRASGRRVVVEVLSREVPGDDTVVVAIRDITERRESEDYIRYLAMHDTLTTLPNRRALESVLTQVIGQAVRKGTLAAVLGLDLDGFKSINDSLGHSVGDMLLREVATRFQAQLRDSDYLARQGGDEFVVVLRTVSSVEDALQLAQRLRACLSQPFSLVGQELFVGVSIGVALCPRDATTAEMALRKADIAMYHVKLHGKGQVSEFHPDMALVVRERRELEQDLRGALNREELTIHYQPLFDSSGRVTGFEALARWPHPVHGMIPPARFIPLAEETGLIIQLGRWVLQTACQVAVTWPEEIGIAVNLSIRQFHRIDLIASVTEALERSGLHPGRLELEITESLLMEDTERALLLVKELQALGVRVALDDFGTGYSSLAYLNRFPFDKIKVDRSFIEQITDDSNARTIVESIISLSHKLHLRVTAEGIETEAQLSLLKSQGCDEMQGFLLGMPMTRESASLIAGRAQVTQLAS